VIDRELEELNDFYRAMDPTARKIILRQAGTLARMRPAPVRLKPALRLVACGAAPLVLDNVSIVRKLG